MTETSETTVITCDCTVCNGLSARIGGNGGNGAEYLKATKKAATMRHNMVRIAHSPLGKAGSARRFGPWAV